MVTDGWRVVDDYYGQAVGKLQAESMMSSGKSFPSVRNQGLVGHEKSSQTTEGDAASLQQLWTIYRAPRPSFASLAATRNLHTHNQILCSQLVMRLSILPVCLKQRV
jgi:hypothetical protein